MVVQHGLTKCLEQILEAVPHKIAATWPLVSNLTNHPSKILGIASRQQEVLASISLPVQNGSSSVQNRNSSVQNGKIIISINIKNIL